MLVEILLKQEVRIEEITKKKLESSIVKKIEGGI